MSDLIERSAVLDLMRTNWADNEGDTAMQLSIDDVRGLPAATAAEDAVSREAVLSALSELPHEYKTKEQRARTGGIAACQVIVGELPLVTPKPKTGHWIHEEDALGLGGYYRCSYCGKSALYRRGSMKMINEKTTFCPHCGAKMEGEEECR